MKKTPVGGLPLRWRSNYCCFGTKLARLVQEQARAQRGIGWGTAQQPQCRALTVQELSLVDFTKIDLSQLLADVKISPPDPQKTISGFTKNWQARLPSKQEVKAAAHLAGQSVESASSSSSSQASPSSSVLGADNPMGQEIRHRKEKIREEKGDFGLHTKAPDREGGLPHEDAKLVF